LLNNQGSSNNQGSNQGNTKEMATNTSADVVTEEAMRRSEVKSALTNKVLQSLYPNENLAKCLQKCKEMSGFAVVTKQSSEETLTMLVRRILTSVKKTQLPENMQITGNQSIEAIEILGMVMAAVAYKKVNNITIKTEDKNTQKLEISGIQPNVKQYLEGYALNNPNEYTPTDVSKALFIQFNGPENFEEVQDNDTHFVNIENANMGNRLNNAIEMLQTVRKETNESTLEEKANSVKGVHANSRQLKEQTVNMVQSGFQTPGSS